MAIPKLLVTAALMAANMALTMTRKIEGPRLDDTKFTGGDYGADLGNFWGIRRREGCPIFWAEDLREISRRRKTKGGKYNEYTYYGTWAVALAGHEIDNVTRIWFDTHLIYDLTGVGPVSPFDFGENAGAASNYITIYTGTESQLADPRIEATVEAEFGEGSCPAYRGTAYIVFKDFPLEKLGNRIPQVSVEFVSNSTDTFPYENFDTIQTQPYRLQGSTFSNDYSRFIWAFSNEYEVWDTASRTRISSGAISPTINGHSRLGIYDSGSIVAVSGDNDFLLQFSPDMLSSSSIASFSDPQEEARVVKDGDGGQHWFTIPWSTSREFYVNGDAIAYRMDELTGVDWTPYDWFADRYGDIWAVGRTVGSSTTCHLLRWVNVSGRSGPDFLSVPGLPSASGVGDIGAVHYLDADHDHFVIHWEHGDLYAIDINDGSIVASNTSISLDAYNTDHQFANCPPGAASIWLNFNEVSLADLTIIRTVDRTDWIAADADGVIYDPVNHALWTFPALDEEINILYLDRASGEGVTLASICADVADWVGVDDYDFTNLDQIVTGWSVTRGPASNMIEPLLDVYDSDIFPSDFQIEGKKRGGSTGGTLTTEYFVGDPRYSISVRQAAQLPRALTINFADIDAEQQPNNVRADRPLDATGARGEKAIDLSTLALDVDDARDLADRYFRRMWNERIEAKLGLTMQQLALEPALIRTLELDGENGDYRLVSMTIRADDTIETEWKYDGPSLASLAGGTGATFDGRNDSAIVVPLPSKGFVLDIPLIRDTHEDTNPIIYTAAGPYAEGSWPGATIYEGEAYEEEFDAVASSSGATWGLTTDTLADANPWLWDRGNTVNVSIKNGDLTGATEAALDANPTLNLMLIGSELLQFSTATLEADGTYTLSGFKRGRRGTEWATGDHTSSDYVLLMDTADDVATDLSDVGTAMTFKTITGGRTDGFITDVSFTGASLKPYAPCHLHAVKEANGDWTLTWTRRTRVGGAWTSGTTIPLSEASEEYEVTVGDGVSSDTKTVTSATTYTWTVAAQTTDTGGEVMAGDLDWSVAQVSDAVGVGFLTEAAA